MWKMTEAKEVWEKALVLWHTDQMVKRNLLLLIKVIYSPLAAFKLIMDHILTIISDCATMNFMQNTLKETLEQLGQKFKELRLAKNLKRQTLALNSGMSESSLKRFETSGEISLESLLKISNVLDVKSWIHSIMNEEHIHSIDQLIKQKIKSKKRGLL